MHPQTAPPSCGGRAATPTSAPTPSRKPAQARRVWQRGRCTGGAQRGTAHHSMAQLGTAAHSSSQRSAHTPRIPLPIPLYRTHPLATLPFAIPAAALQGAGGRGGQRVRAPHQQLPDYRGRGWLLGLLRCGGGCLRDAGWSKSTATVLVALPVIGQALHGPLLQRRHRLAAAWGGLAACRPELCSAYTLPPLHQQMQCCSSHPYNSTPALLTTLCCCVCL